MPTFGKIEHFTNTFWSSFWNHFKSMLFFFRWCFVSVYSRFLVLIQVVRLVEAQSLGRQAEAAPSVMVLNVPWRIYLDWRRRKNNTKTGFIPNVAQHPNGKKGDIQGKVPQLTRCLSWSNDKPDGQNAHWISTTAIRICPLRLAMGTPLFQLRDLALYS